MSEERREEPGAGPRTLLAAWISREQLAEELMVKPDTLSRWDARRVGPPCMRIGRKVFYRRTGVEQWLASREQGHPVRKGRGQR